MDHVWIYMDYTIEVFWLNHPSFGWEWIHETLGLPCNQTWFAGRRPYSFSHVFFPISDAHETFQHRLHLAKTEKIVGGLYFLPHIPTDGAPNSGWILAICWPENSCHHAAILETCPNPSSPRKPMVVSIQSHFMMGWFGATPIWRNLHTLGGTSHPDKENRAPSVE